jgi:outer membrane protein OmpA-like peptidoglycan-associated protein
MLRLAAAFADGAYHIIAGVSKDQRCDTVKAENAGHADFFGPRPYNQALSETRAQLQVLKSKG